jgi:glycosyltransferase involved in cell wall biosynthesis
MPDRAPKHALYLSPLPPPIGGISTWMRILVEKGLPGGWQPRVVDTSVGPGREVFQRESLLAELRRGLRIVTALIRALIAERPALVHVNVAPLTVGFLRDALCAAITRLFRVPVVLHYHGLFVQPPAPASGATRALLWCLARTARHVQLNLTMNEPSRRFLAQLVGSSRTQVACLPNFYDESAFAALERVPRAESARPRAIFVAGLTLAKGAGLVADAARALPEVDFHLVGRRYDETRSQLADPPPNLIVHGELEHAAVLREMAASDVFVFPTRYPEGFPFVVLEAMRVALPVVSTRVGAIPDMIVDGQGGRLIEPDVPELVTALRDVLADELRRAAMGRFNAERAQSLYAFDVVAAELTRLYDDAMT